jgi:uncharacterized protein (DUF2235 family)
MAGKRLVVCCDGTWNTPDEVRGGRPCPTNVAKIAAAVVTPRDGEGVEQRVYYHRGVGTGRLDHFTGGAFGWGLSRNVQDAYMFLVENWDDPADEIFLFGFSRGAYIARSVAGFIRNSGLLKARWARKLDTAYELYRDRTHATHPNAMESQLFRKSFSSEVRIKFIGVWDTVGALGIPIDSLGIHVLSDRWKFHDVKLSTSVDNAFHAIAIDERRRPFTPAIWEQQPGAMHVMQRLEQVWFPGVHSDVGGGYPQAGLSDVALEWMGQRARQCDLAIDFAGAGIPVAPDATGYLHDSMTARYRILGSRPRLMPVQRLDDRGRPMVTNEAVIDQAALRLNSPTYHAPNLREFLANGGRQAKM